MDDNKSKLEAALADLVFYKIEIITLNNTINFLKEENNRLRSSVTNIIFDSKNKYKYKCRHTDTKKKLEYYHKMKEEVAKKLHDNTKYPDGVPWNIIKQHTDIMYEKEIGYTEL